MWLAHFFLLGLCVLASLRISPLIPPQIGSVEDLDASTAKSVLGSPSVFQGNFCWTVLPPIPFLLCVHFCLTALSLLLFTAVFHNRLCQQSLRRHILSLCITTHNVYLSIPRMTAHLGCWRKAPRILCWTWGSSGACHIEQAEAGTFGGRRISVIQVFMLRN